MADTLFYYEQRAFDGTWHPRSAPDRPREAKKNSSEPAIRNVREVEPLLQGHGLKILEKLYGTREPEE